MVPKGMVADSKMKNTVFPFLLVLLLSVVTLPGAAGLEKAPDFKLTDTEGRAVSLSSFSGRYLLIDFFATWCAPCALQILHLKDLKSQFGSNISIVSIGIDPVSDSNQSLIDYKKKYGIDWTVALDTQNTGIKYRVTSIPTLALVDPSGSIVRTWVGVADANAIIQELPFKPSTQAPASTTSTQTVSNTDQSSASNQGNTSSAQLPIIIIAVVDIVAAILAIRLRGHVKMFRPESEGKA